jgi:serine/threonine protein kinase
MICPLCHAENLPDSRFCHKCATPLYIEKDVPLPTLTLQKQIDKFSRGSILAGRYEIIEELGKGGMGRVYKVFDQKIKEIVALKLIHPEISVNEKAIERFRNELKFSRKVSHRNVCRMHDLGEEGYMHFITMEYVDGENLKGFIRRAGQLTPGKAVSVAKQVCEGLAEAHRQGLVHRDLKPQNIMIDREGNARIMDFGIARFVEAEGLTGSGVMIGTPEYMSPEQAESKGVDKRADIYSLGIILYEMVTGKVPFEGETPLTIILKHKNEVARNPQELNPHLPGEMTKLIFKCLEKDREKRYQSAEEVLKDLTLVEQGLPTAERALAKKALAASKEITVTFRFQKLVLPVLAIFILAVVALFIWNPFSKKQGPASEAQEIPQVVKGVVPSASHPERLPSKRSKAEAPKTGIEKQKTEKPQLEKDIASWFNPEVLKSIPEAFKSMNPKDMKDLKDVEKFVENLKAALPQGSVFSEHLDRAMEKIKEGRKLQEEGKAEEAGKSQREGQAEMDKLLSLVAEREGAQKAQTLLEAAKSQVKKSNVDEKNLLYRLASRREQDAVDAFQKEDFSGAKTLYVVLERIFRLSLKCQGDELCLKELAAYVRQLKGEVESSYSVSLDPWLYEKAVEDENKANLSLANKEYENAAESFIQAAFLYEKIKDKALPKK